MWTASCSRADPIPPPTPPNHPLRGRPLRERCQQKLHKLPSALRAPGEGVASPLIGASPSLARGEQHVHFLLLNKSEKGGNAKLLISIDPDRATLLDLSSNFASRI